MKGINPELDAKVKSECMIKEAFANARETVKLQRPVTRRKIEDIKEAHELKNIDNEYAE